MQKIESAYYDTLDPTNPYEKGKSRRIQLTDEELAFLYSLDHELE